MCITRYLKGKLIQRLPTFNDNTALSSPGVLLASQRVSFCLTSSTYLFKSAIDCSV